MVDINKIIEEYLNEGPPMPGDPGWDPNLVGNTQTFSGKRDPNTGDVLISTDSGPFEVDPIKPVKESPWSRGPGEGVSFNDWIIEMQSGSVNTGDDDGDPTDGTLETGFNDPHGILDKLEGEDEEEIPTVTMQGGIIIDDDGNITWSALPWVIDGGGTTPLEINPVDIKSIWDLLFD